MTWPESILWSVVAICAMTTAVHLLVGGFSITLRTETSRDDEEGDLE